jgi:SAM-dependent methyltransferase
VTRSRPLPRPRTNARRGCKTFELLARNRRTRWLLSTTPGGAIEPLHGSFVKRFLSKLPAGGKVLDAACGTGKYFTMVLSGGHSLVGVDQAGASLGIAQAKFPGVPTEKHYLQDLPYRDEFDGVMCVDAMEFVPPEDWPGVLELIHRALHAGGWLYFTIEVAADDAIRAANEKARRSGLPVVDGEVMWGDPDPYYHHYPSIERVRKWVAAAGFNIKEDARGPWTEDHAYHHVLARAI